METGSTFSEAFNINEDSGISAIAQISIAPEVGNLYFIWQDNNAGNSVIYFTKTRLAGKLNTS